MMRKIGVRRAAQAFLVGLGCLAAYHVLLLAGIAPADAAWGGRVDRSSAQFVRLELLGLGILALFAAIVALRAGLLGAGRLRRSARVGAWVVVAYFALNVLGNLASLSGVERAVFTPVSAVLALLALRVAIGGGD